MRRFTLNYTLFISLLLLNACKQPALKEDATLLPVEKMRSDLSILWEAIKEMHPAYGIYTNADSLGKVYDRVKGSLDTPLSETDFITHIYPLICSLRCGHTQIHHSGNYQSPAKGAPSLPFEVLVKDHRVWVTNHQTVGFATGDELLSVNAIPAATLVDHGYDLYAGDGFNETFKELFLSEYDGFEDVFNKCYHWKPPYTVVLRTRNDSVKTILIDALPEGVKLSVSPGKMGNNWVEAKGTDYLPLRFLANSSTAWFEVKSYQYNDTVIYKEAFRQIRERGIKDLIIDLRHNTGGDIRIAAKLLSYLADSAYRILGDIKSRLPDPSVNHFESYFDTARTASFIMGFSPGKKEGSYYHMDFKPVFGDMLGVLRLDGKRHYTGNLYVLIDGATFSAGAHTAIAIQTQCKKAVLIGRETAGGVEGCSGGTIQHLTLPNTGIVVEFPWMRVVSVAKHPAFGHGVMPDYLVDYTAVDVVEKRDQDIAKALSLIRH